jgi:hypothetical protein
MPAADEKAALERRRTILLVVLAVILAGAVIYAIWPAAGPKGAPSNPPRDARRQQQGTTGSRGTLEVRLGELTEPPPEPADAKRNPFKFYVPPPPPPPPKPPPMPPPPPPPKPGDTDYVPPPPPPISGAIRFIGTAEQGTTKVAIFVTTDGKGPPVHAKEGDLVLGQYRLVKIQVESVVMEYPDGKGRQIIPMRGQ